MQLRVALLERERERLEDAGLKDRSEAATSHGVLTATIPYFPHPPCHQVLAATRSCKRKGLDSSREPPEEGPLC